MTKYLYILLVIGITTSSFNFKAGGIRDEVAVLAKVAGLERVRDIIIENKHEIITNGHISSDVELYIDEVPVSMEQSQVEKNTQSSLIIQKYVINDTSAKVLITGNEVRIKVKLTKFEDEWHVKSYYIKNGKSVSISVDW